MKICYKALAVLFAVSLPQSGFPQVEKVEMKTTGISCGVCAAVSEIYLRQLKSIDQISISRSKESVSVTYKAGSDFQPQELRRALLKTEVGVTELRVVARGRLQDQAGRRTLIAGKERFTVLPSRAPIPPLNTDVRVEGIVDDRAAPMTLTILSAKPVK